MNRDFKGVWIPKEVYLDTRLTALEKIILVEIDSLDNGEDGCFASNEYLAEFCQCTKVKVSTAISKLIEFGYLDKAGFDGRRRILKSRLKLSLRQTQTNFKADTNKVDSNNKDNNKDNNKSNKDIKEIVNYLNENAGTHYRSTTDATIKVITARLNEKFTVDDFKTVIDKKVSQWKGTSMEEYLRPQTLFGSKFESYLNQTINKQEKAAKSKNTPPEPPRYKQFTPDEELDAVPMPDEVRKKMFNYEKELGV